MIGNVPASVALALAIILFHQSPMCGERPAEDKPAAAVIINHLTNLYTPVTFDHQLHADYASCSECHHHTTGLLPSRPKCAACHKVGKKTGPVACRSCHQPSMDRTTIKGSTASGSIYHIDIPALVGAYHLSCIDCHEIIGTGPTQCNECHTMTERGKQFYQIRK